MSFQSLTAVLDLDSSGFRSGIEQAESDLGNLSDRAQSAGKSLQRAGGLLTAGLTAPLVAMGVQSVRTASSVEELESKTDAVFKESADDVREWADVTAEELGRSRFQMQEMATSFQDVLVPIGMARGEASDMSRELAILSSDLASFNDVADEDAARKLESALVGNHAAVRDFGVILTQERLDKQLGEMFDIGVKGATEQQKAMARLELIMSDTADAQGDAARTSDSFANKMRSLRGSTKDLSAEIGQHLLPLASSLIDHISRAVSWFSDWDKSHQKLAVGVGVAAAALGPLLFGIGSFLALIPSIVAGASAIGTALTLMTGPIGILIAGVGAFAAAWATDFMGIRGHTATAVNAVIGLINKLIGRINSILPDKYKIDFEAGEVDFTKVKEKAEETSEESDEEITVGGGGGGGGGGGSAVTEGDIVGETTPAIRKALKKGVQGYVSDPEKIGDKTAINRDLVEAVGKTGVGASPETLGISAEEFNRLMGAGSAGSGGTSIAELMAGGAAPGRGAGGGGTDMVSALREAIGDLALRVETGDETLDRVIEERAEVVVDERFRNEADRASRGVGGNPGAGR